MKLLSLFLKMLRYRAALMIWMFLLLGAAYGGQMKSLEVDLLWAVVALASSYVFATTVNDLADEKVDRINHPGDEGRPLVTGSADRRELRVLSYAASAIALLAGGMIGARSLALVAAGLSVAVAYSAEPLKISYRSSASPLLLAVGYVAVPYALGVEVEGGSLSRTDAGFLGALTALFLARIALKDFRDRRGDEIYGKPTLLLQFGKRATCSVSFAALLMGDALLGYSFWGSPTLVVVLQLFFLGINYVLQRLRGAEDPRVEQVMIGIGARLGNGLLLSVLGWVLLATSGAPERHRLAFVMVIAVAYGSNFLMLRSRPAEVLIGYKG